MDYAEISLLDTPSSSAPKEFTIYTGYIMFFTRSFQQASTLNCLVCKLPIKPVDFIFLRQLCVTVSLYESFTFELKSRHIRFTFSTGQVLNCDIKAFQNDVLVAVATTVGSATFIFHHPMKFRQVNSHVQFSIFHGFDLSAHSFHPLRTSSPVTMARSIISENGWVTSVYSTSNGSLNVCSTPPHDSTEAVEYFDIQQSGFVQKILSGIVPSFINKGNRECASGSCDLCSIPLSNELGFVVTVCKDNRLRFWDLQNRNCFMILDLTENLPDDSADSYNDKPNESTEMQFPINTVRHSIRFISSGKVGYLMVYFNDSTSALWMIYMVDLAALKNRERVAVSFNQHDHLQVSTFGQHFNKMMSLIGHDLENAFDFISTELQPIDFVPIVDNKGSCLGVWWLCPGAENETASSLVYSGFGLESLGSKSALSPFNCIGQQNASYLDTWPSADSITDIESVVLPLFLDALFQPGRFSRHAIIQAAQSMLKRCSLNQQDIFNKHGSLLQLRNELQSILLNLIRQSTEVEAASFQLQSLYEATLAFHAKSQEPLGLFSLFHEASSTGDHYQSIIVIRRYGYSVLRKIHDLEKWLFDYDRLFRSSGTDEASSEETAVLRKSAMLLYRVCSDNEWQTNWHSRLLSGEPTVLLNLMHEIRFDSMTLDQITWNEYSPKKIQKAFISLISLLDRPDEQLWTDTCRLVCQANNINEATLLDCAGNCWLYVHFRAPCISGSGNNKLLLETEALASSARSDSLLESYSSSYLELLRLHLDQSLEARLRIALAVSLLWSAYNSATRKGDLCFEQEEEELQELDQASNVSTITGPGSEPGDSDDEECDDINLVSVDRYL
ncbi:hypothetical protein Ciccas_002109, partial [Cichlidogyrus casuarinus]